MPSLVASDATMPVLRAFRTRAFRALATYCVFGPERRRRTGNVPADNQPSLLTPPGCCANTKRAVALTATQAVENLGHFITPSPLSVTVRTVPRECDQ